jgi:dihydroorotase-like cyclic amidohydrolase
MQDTVSSRAKAIIGRNPTHLSLAPGEPADFILFDTLESGWRCRKSIVEVVYDAGSTRQTIFRGNLIASKDYSHPRLSSSRCR